MPGIRPVFEKGPLTFSATTQANGGLIKGGQLVEPDPANNGRIRVAAVGSAKVLGVALGDAAPSDFNTADTADAWGNTVTNMTSHPNEVAVAYQGVWLLTNRHATAAINFGDLVVVAGTGGNAGGVAARAAEGLETVVGRCVEPGGIVAGKPGKILLGSVGA